jgi:hypothetical protein
MTELGSVAGRKVRTSPIGPGPSSEFTRGPGNRQGYRLRPNSPILPQNWPQLLKVVYSTGSVKCSSDWVGECGWTQGQTVPILGQSHPVKFPWGQVIGRGIVYG